MMGRLLSTALCVKRPTNLVFAPEQLHDLGRQSYYPGKDLHLFAVRTTLAATDIEKCRCNSYFERPKTGQTNQS